ncbi:MAG: hypothetical protein WA667_02170 [Candidatus Nitrosopolaris sp.]
MSYSPLQQDCSMDPMSSACSQTGTHNQTLSDAVACGQVFNCPLGPNANSSGEPMAKTW